METTHKVRVVTLDGAPWFLATDVCAALGLGLEKGTNTHTRKLDADERRGVTPSQVRGLRGLGATAVSESGLYKLILRSDAPTAAPFKDWVTREVLPAIRKTGGYVLAGADPATVEVGATATGETG
nr:BRO family protein [Rhodoplanes elegans]